MNRGDASPLLNADDLRAELNTRRIGRTILVLPEVDSTNSYVLDQLTPCRGEAADGTVVFAEHQTAGRGRLGRSWHSPRGASLMFTVLLCRREAWAAARLIMAAGVAVVEGIAEATEVEPVLRWPNDVYSRGRKLAGILVECRAAAAGLRATAIGIGVNCLQHVSHFLPELRATATSLDIEARHPVDRTAVARAALRRLDAWLGDAGGRGPAPELDADQELAAAWRRHSADLGSRVTLLADGRTFTGRILDISPIDGLLLQLDDGGRRLFDPATASRTP